MHKNITFPKAIEERLLAYRKSRKTETGKMIFRETAIVELLQKALEGFEPARPVEDRLADIEKRLDVLEADNR